MEDDGGDVKMPDAKRQKIDVEDSSLLRGAHGAAVGYDLALPHVATGGARNDQQMDDLPAADHDFDTFTEPNTVVISEPLQGDQGWQEGVGSSDEMAGLLSQGGASSGGRSSGARSMVADWLTLGDLALQVPSGFAGINGSQGQQQLANAAAYQLLAVSHEQYRQQRESCCSSTDGQGSALDDDSRSSSSSSFYFSGDSCSSNGDCVDSSTAGLRCDCRRCIVRSGAVDSGVPVTAASAAVAGIAAAAAPATECTEDDADDESRGRTHSAASHRRVRMEDFGAIAAAAGAAAEGDYSYDYGSGNYVEIEWLPRSAVMEQLLRSTRTETRLRIANLLVYCAALLEHVAYCVGFGSGIGAGAAEGIFAADCSSGSAYPSCQRPTCVCLRLVVQHCRGCRQRLSHCCWLCRAVATMALWHSERCFRADCAVPFCSGRPLGNSDILSRLCCQSAADAAEQALQPMDLLEEQNDLAYLTMASDSADALWRHPTVAMDFAYGLPLLLVGSFSHMADPVGSAIVRMLQRALCGPCANEQLPEAGAGWGRWLMSPGLVVAISEARWSETCDIVMHWLGAERACLCQSCLSVSTAASAAPLKADRLLGYVGVNGHLLMQERDGRQGIACCLTMLHHVCSCACLSAVECPFPRAFPVRFRLMQHERSCSSNIAASRCEADRCIVSLWFFHALRCIVSGCAMPWCSIIRRRLRACRAGARAPSRVDDVSDEVELCVSTSSLSSSCRAPV